MNGLALIKLELDLKVDTLDADVKSLKKASRQTVMPEILNRINQIIDTKLIEIKKDFKIYWNNSPIATLLKGKDYLSHDIELVIDDMIEIKERNMRDIEYSFVIIVKSSSMYGKRIVYWVFVCPSISYYIVDAHCFS